VLLDRINSLE